MKNEMEPIVVTTTSDDREKLLTLARALVEQSVAACAQVSTSPITSVYRWDGKVETSDEFVLTIKTSRHHFRAVENTIGKNHNYDVPQIVAVPITGIGEKYREWMDGKLNG